MQRLRPRRPLVVATLATFAFAGPVACLAFGVPTMGVAAASALSGVGIAVFVTLWESTIQREISTHLLSRVAAYDWLGSYALTPVGFVMAAVMSTQIGARDTLFLSASWAVLSSTVVLAMPSVRRIRTDPIRGANSTVQV